MYTLMWTSSAGLSMRRAGVLTLLPKPLKPDALNDCP